MAGLEPGREQGARAELSREGETSVVRLSGELDLASTGEVGPVVEKAIEGEADRVVFDMAELTFMDSSGIALLLSVADRGIEVELRSPPAIVRRLLELTGLDKTVRILE